MASSTSFFWSSLRFAPVSITVVFFSGRDIVVEELVAVGLLAIFGEPQLHSPDISNAEMVSSITFLDGFM